MNKKFEPLVDRVVTVKTKEGGVFKVCLERHVASALNGFVAGLKSDELYSGAKIYQRLQTWFYDFYNQAGPKKYN